MQFSMELRKEEWEKTEARKEEGSGYEERREGRN